MVRQQREEKEFLEAEEEDLQRMNELLEASKPHLEDFHTLESESEKDSDDEASGADDEDSGTEEEDQSSAEDENQPISSHPHRDGLDVVHTYPTPPGSSHPDEDVNIDAPMSDLRTMSPSIAHADHDSLFTDPADELSQSDLDGEDTPAPQSSFASTVNDAIEGGKLDADNEEPTPTNIQPQPFTSDHLAPYASVPVEWESVKKFKIPFLLRGTLRSYQQEGFRWLAKLHSRHHDGLLADEMGLGYAPNDSLCHIPI